MTLLVATFVAGLPRTKGSLAKRPNGTLYDSVVDSGRWRALMAGALRDAYRAQWARTYCTGPIGMCSHPDWFACGRPVPHDGPVEVSAAFALPVDPLTFGAGDLDKLLRNLLDALGTRSKNPRYNGGIIVDDNQVVRFPGVSKHGPAERPGVEVEVHTAGQRWQHLDCGTVVTSPGRPGPHACIVCEHAPGPWTRVDRPSDQSPTHGRLVP